MKRCTVLFVFLVIFGVSAVQAAFQYETDFDSLDRSFWLVFDHGGHFSDYFPPKYEAARIENGMLVLEVNETDHGPELITKGIPVSPNSVVTVEWRAQVHYANEYFAGQAGFYLTDYEGFYAPGSNYQIPPFRTSDDQELAVAAVYYRNYAYNNYPPPVGGESFGICGGNHQCLVSDPVWDRPFTNKVEINFPEGKVRFWQNGNYLGEVPVAHLPDAHTSYLKISFSPYGWWTGHSLRLDYFRLNVTEAGSSGGPQPPEDCKAIFDPQTGRLTLPVVVVGSEAYAAILQLTIPFPVPEFSLLSVEPASCPPSPCAATFDLQTNELEIPAIRVNQHLYRARLILSSPFPAKFSVEEVNEGSCTPGGTCSDCACPEYAAHHPQECGRTGNLNFRLIWHDTNDVDLRVDYLSNGELRETINYQKPHGEITGGELDKDANANCESVTSSPVENIVFENPPSGTYRVLICPYRLCDTRHPTSTVEVQVLQNGQIVDSHTVTISDWNNCQTVFEYRVP